jgi:hypothetical protein
MLETVVVDMAGRPVPWAVGAFVRSDTDGRPEKAVRVQRIAPLKYGIYKLTVECPGAYTSEKLVKITAPYQVVIVAVDFPQPENLTTKNFVQGRLSQASRKSGCQFARLASVVAEGEFANAKASDAGVFAFEDVKPGRYILVTMGTLGVCDATLVTVTGERTQDLSIP